jgi:hypothetical protein
MSRPRWGPPIAWAAVILLLTSIPGSELQDVSALGFPGADKVVHGLLYGVFGWLAARAWLRPLPSLRPLLRVLAGIALFALLDEWHQQFIPGRSMDALDLLADLAGASAGLVAAAAWLRRAQHS